MSRGTRERAAERLSDGRALDRMTDAAEAWAKGYGRLRDEAAWASDFDAKLERLAASLAAKTAAPARDFAVRDWILGIVLWALIGMAVFVGSVLVMELSGGWTIAFGIVAILIAIVGFGVTYVETTSARRARRRLAKKERWLMDAARTIAFDILRARRDDEAAR